MALLRHVGVDRAHIVGHSGGGRIALQLVLGAPEVVHSLVVLEPAGVGPVPSRQAFVDEVIKPARERYRAGDTVGAVDVFWSRGAYGSPEWRREIERMVPGGPKQAEQDAATFFEDPTPTERWEFDEEKAEKISQKIPMLYVLGSESPPHLKEGRDLFHTWFPQTEDHRVQGVGHSLQMEDPQTVAESIADFLKRHPLKETSNQ